VSGRWLPQPCSLISHQPAVLFSHNKSATSNQPTILFSQEKSAPAISHQPNEHAARQTAARRGSRQPLPAMPLGLPPGWWLSRLRETASVRGRTWREHRGKVKERQRLSAENSHIHTHTHIYTHVLIYTLGVERNSTPSSNY
jgi:hypothetical protein